MERTITVPTDAPETTRTCGPALRRRNVSRRGVAASITGTPSMETESPVLISVSTAANTQPSRGAQKSNARAPAEPSSRAASISVAKLFNLRCPFAETVAGGTTRYRNTSDESSAPSALATTRAVSRPSLAPAGSLQTARPSDIGARTSPPETLSKANLASHPEDIMPFGRRP